MFTSWSWRSRNALSLLVLLLLLPRPAPAAPTNCVILITIDGMAAFYLADTNAAMPTLRRLAAQGAVAEALRVSNPAITWPNHTTLVTGVSPARHSVLFNGKLLRGGPGEPVELDPRRDKTDLVAVPTLYDYLHQAGARTAAINWPCTRGAPTLDDDFPDTPERLTHTTPRLRAELVRDGVLEDITDASFGRKSALARDQAWTAAALHVLKQRPPQLLLLHLLLTDGVQHHYGPQSPEAYQALAAADDRLKEIVDALASQGRLAHTTLLVVSDHGFARPTQLIRPNVVLRKAGLLRPVPRRRAQCLAEGGTAFVYLTHPASAAADRVQVLDLLRGIEGIARIVEPADFAALGLPNPANNPQMGDLLLVAQEGYAFGDEDFEDEVLTPLPRPVGSHGYIASDPHMNGVFVAWGRGIRPGTKLGYVDNIDVAPTIGALLGQGLPRAQGKVLRAMLREEALR